MRAGPPAPGRVVVVIPTFNEAESIAAVVAEIPRDVVRDKTNQRVHRIHVGTSFRQLRGFSMGPGVSLESYAMSGDEPIELPALSALRGEPCAAVCTGGHLAAQRQASDRRGLAACRRRVPASRVHLRHALGTAAARALGGDQRSSQAQHLDATPAAETPDHQDAAAAAVHHRAHHHRARVVGRSGRGDHQVRARACGACRSHFFRTGSSCDGRVMKIFVNGRNLRVTPALHAYAG